MPLSDYRHKITIKRPDAPKQTAGGGLVAAYKADECVTKWAKVESRSGGLQVSDGQREWSYDFKITTRYTKDFIEEGGDIVLYDCKTLLVRSVSFDNEGRRGEVILRCSNNG
jgi:SPP1 family predicted phage head-tail adaptor